MTGTRRTHARAVLVAVLLPSLLLVSCGDGPSLSEAEKKAFIGEFVRLGDAAESATMQQHGEDEQAQTEAFRKEIERIRAGLYEKYGVDQAGAEEIFLEAREKGWW